MRNRLREMIVTRSLVGEKKASIARDLHDNINTVKKAWKLYQKKGTTYYQAHTGKSRSVRAMRT